MRRWIFLLLALQFVACNENKVPPMAPPMTPQKAGDPQPDNPPECEPGCGDGGQQIPRPAAGQGLSGWKYLWATPSSSWTSAVGWSKVTTFANQTLLARPTTMPSDPYERRRIAHLIDQDGQAEQIAVAKAMVYRVDPNAPAAYYDDVWAALQEVIKNVTMTESNQAYYNSTWNSICNDAEIGVARNLLGWLVAADYLMSMGPPSTPASAGANDNSATYDALKDLCAGVLVTSQNQTYSFPDGGASPCAKGTSGTVLNNVLKSPNNKGAAALASWAAVGSLGTNMQTNAGLFINPVTGQPFNCSQWLNFCPWGNSTAYSNALATANSYVKGWQAIGDAQGGHSFPATNFEKINGSFDNTWVQSDASSPVPLKQAGRTVKWPLTAQTCSPTSPYACIWQSDGQFDQLEGMPVDDMIKTSQYTPEYVCNNGAAVGFGCNLIVPEGHVAGSIGYLANALTVLYVEQQNGTIFSGTNYLIPKSHVWYDEWANTWHRIDPNPLTNPFPLLKDCDDDWPASYLWKYWSLAVGGWTGPAVGDGPSGTRASAPLDNTDLGREGKQMSFTDVTHP